MGKRSKEDIAEYNAKAVTVVESVFGKKPEKIEYKIFE